MTEEQLEERSENTLRETDTYRVPVPIQLVAQRLNMTMEAGPLGENVSGMLIMRGDRSAIGYNSAHGHARRRFTIAHEIAHSLLHKRKNAKPQLFIDRRIMHRYDETVSRKAGRKEAEADRFGAALLMPRVLIQNEIKNQNLNLDDDGAIDVLAKRFQVSTAALTARLLSLQILH